MAIIKRVTISPSTRKDKKRVARFYDGNGRMVRTTHFGAAGYADFTVHKDPRRRAAYLARHRKNEDWNDFTSPGSLARYVLWNRPTLASSVRDFKHRFGLR